MTEESQKIAETAATPQEQDFTTVRADSRALFEKLDKQDPVLLYGEAKKLHELLLNTKFYGLIAENLSLCGVLEYMLSPNNYKTSINMLEDAKFLAHNAQDKSAIKTNYFCRSLVFTLEKKYSEALINLTKAKTVYLEDDFLEEKTEQLLKQIENSKDTESFSSNDSKKSLFALLNVARTLAAETSVEMLLQTVAQEIKKVLNADRCSVFLLDKASNQLWSKLATGMESKEIRFDADKGLSGYVAQTGEIVNIKNAYEDSRFNRDVDVTTGYKTNTVLCMPMMNMKHEILGVFQVLNKLDGHFTKEDEELLLVIGSSAGIAIENSKLFEAQQKMIDEQKMLFQSFIDTLSASIDARDKITAGHSSRVKMYAELICENLCLEKNLKESIIHGAILHDIGKIGIRDSVLQKDGKLTDEEYQHIQEHVKITYDILNKVYLSDEFKQVAEIASSHHEKYDGTGYFRKIAGEEICLGGRILAVSDVFDAITSKRHYRDKMPIKNALDIIKSGSGKHFDPKIVDSFFSIKLDKLVNVFLSEVDWVLKSDDGVELSKYTVDNLNTLITTKTEETFDESEKRLFDVFNYYYNCKAGN